MICPMCREPMGEMCEECGVFFEKPEFIVTDLSTFKIKHKRVYKRLDHFKEVLSQFQGKEGKEIPREVVDKLKQNINKERTTITLDDVKLGLRKLKLNKYILKIFYIFTTCCPGPTYPTSNGKSKTRWFDCLSNWTGCSGKSGRRCPLPEPAL